jgi:hypothetical protein
MWLQRFKKLKRNIEKTRQQKAKLFKKVQSFFKSPKELRPAKLTNKTGFDIILETCASTKRNIQIARTTDLMYNLQLINVKPKKKKEYQYIFKQGSTVKSKTYSFEEALVKNGIIKWIFGEFEFGDFVVPESIVDYTAQARRDKRVPDKSLPTVKTLLDKGKKYYEMVEKETEINKKALFGILGAFWSEIAWAFESKDAQINKQEMHGDKSEEEQKELNNGTVNANVVTGTTGASGCGEGWFGLTFWSQKQIIIRELKKLKSSGKLNDPVIDELIESEDATTGYGSNGKMLAHCSDETWCKICEIYMKKCAVTSGKALLSDSEDPDMEELLCASFLWKAADGAATEKGLNMDAVEDVVQMYIRSHEKQNRANNPNYKAKNGFAHMIYAGIMLALYMDTNEVPTIEEVDKLIGV